MSEGGLSGSTYPLDPIPFEAFHEGSWHEADLISIQNGNISVRITCPTPTSLVNIHTDLLRTRSRKATVLDCSNFLRSGIDVCVFLPRPASSNSDKESQPQQFAWLDARIIKIQRSHGDTCKCLFAVIPYKFNGQTHKRNLMSDHARTILVTLNQISILQNPHVSDENGNIFLNSTKNATSIFKTKLFNFSDAFSSAVATLLVLSTLCGLIEVKVVQDKIVYHIREDDIGQDGKPMNMKVVNFINFDGVIEPKVDKMSIERTFTEERRALIRRSEECIAVLNADIVYENMNIRRSDRKKNQTNFFHFDASPNSGHSSYARSATVPSHSKSEPKKEPVKEEEALQVKHAVESSPIKGKPKQKALLEEKGRGPYLVHEKQGVKRKNFSTEECDDSIEKPMKDQGMRKERGPYRPRKKLNAQRKEHELIEELMRDIKCCMSKKAKPGFQKEEEGEGEEKKKEEGGGEREETKEEEACASAPGYYPLVFDWPPPNSDGEADKEKDEYEDLWEEMDYCLNAVALEEEKKREQCSIRCKRDQVGIITYFRRKMQLKNMGSGDETATGEDKEESCVHDCVLDEQIGLICKHCNVVCTEIRHILPPMMKGRIYQIPKDRVSPRSDPFKIDPSVLETAPSTNLPKGSNNIWAPILHIEPKLQSHQKKAFEFIWKNLTGSLELEEMNSANGNTGGCVLSHTPGSGKTLTVISFLISHLEVFPQSRPLVLTPKSAIHTWKREFQKWGIEVPLHIIHQDIACQKGTSVGKTKGYLDSYRRPSRKNARVVDSLEKVTLWHKNPGVLLLTYPSFLSLMKEGSRNEYRKFMANVLKNSPGLLVLDEGHNPRSTSSKLRRLLMKVKTESRILLSGTVFQNNFEEYFNTLCLARPRFIKDVITKLKPNTSKRARKAIGEERRAQNFFVEKIGQKIESEDTWDRNEGFNLLTETTSGFIHFFYGEKLHNLPGIEIYTIFLQCLELQEKVLQTVQNSFTHGSRFPIEMEFLVSVGAIHPCLVSTSKAAKAFFTDKELKEIGSKQDFLKGSKTSFVIDTILKSLMTKEKVLVFCHNIKPLKLLIKQIECTFEWREGEEILFLYGDQELSVRSDIIDKFNADMKGKGKVLLASTNACAEGISLTAASRIVFLDSEWNPSKTKQAIARAFRPGQEKVVYVYLLVAAGTWEDSKYQSNRKKARMSKMVLSGKYMEIPSAEPVNTGDITDELLKEIVQDDKGKTVNLVVKHLNDEV